MGKGNDTREQIFTSMGWRGNSGCAAAPWRQRFVSQLATSEITLE